MVSQHATKLLDPLLADLGRLLGATKLLDLTLDDQDQIDGLADHFFQGAGRLIPPRRAGGASADNAPSG